MCFCLLPASPAPSQIQTPPGVTPQGSPRGGRNTEQKTNTDLEQYENDGGGGGGGGAKDAPNSITAAKVIVDLEITPICMNEPLLLS